MIFSGSRSARRRRRSWRARSPNSCSSAINASGGCVEHQAGRNRRDRDRRAAHRLSTKADQLSTSVRPHVRRCRMSSSISRRPADSAAISTRPWKSLRKRASSRAGSSLRGSMRSAGGGTRREVLVGQGLRQRIELDARQLDAPKGCRAAARARRRHEHFAPAQDRPLGVVAALLVAACDFGERLRGGTAARRVSTATIVFAGR